MRDARLWGTRLWDGFCEKHASERHAYLHRLEKRGEPSWPAGAWNTGRLGYRVPPAAVPMLGRDVASGIAGGLAGRQPVTLSRVTISKV